MNKIVIFALGLVSGAVGSYLYLNKKYNDRFESEMEDIKEYYAEKTDGENGVDMGLALVNGLEDGIQDNKEVSDQEEYENIVKVHDYSSHFKSMMEHDGRKTEPDEIDEIFDTVDNVEHIDPENPYIIEPSKFGEYADLEGSEMFDVAYLTLYSDGVLCDSMNVPIIEVDKLVNVDNLKEMGKYEDGLLHIRNEKYRCDYEIEYDERTFVESVPLGEDSNE